VGTANVGSRAPACPPFIVALRERGPTAIHGRRPRSGRGLTGFPIWRSGDHFPNRLLSPLRERTTLSLYVDDATLFLNPTKADVEMTIQIMHMFRMASGLKINTGKSSMVPIQCQEIDTDDVLQCLDGSRAAFPINYLGLPFTTRRLRIAHLQLILDKAAMRMSGWQGNLMNIGGRRELVKTVLSALPTYLLTAIKPPKKLYKDLDKLRRKFLLARNLRLHGGKCKVSWPKVYRPLNRGGLGIHNLDLFGTSL
jgi:hypothetical protein